MAFGSIIFEFDSINNSASIASVNIVAHKSSESSKFVPGG